MRIIRQLQALACFSLVVLTGCESTQSNGALSPPALTPSPYSRIGTITQLNLDSATVVVRLDRRDAQLDTELFVRNSQRAIVSVVRPTGLRTGNSVGMVILSGSPLVGQEVVQKMQP